MKPGFKETETGIIPEDWDCLTLSSFVTTGPKNGYSGRSSKNARGTLTLGLGATSSGRLVLSDETVKRLEQTIDEQSDLFLKSNDVLVQRANTIELVGTTAVFDGPPDVYVYPDLMMRIRFDDEATAHWFWRYANSRNGRRFFMAVAAGSSGSMPKISGAALQRMQIPIPPRREQRAIATALSDVDALLEGLDRLIAKKRELKQAVMQQLLTGQTRLPGFRGDWKLRFLGDVAHIKTGSRNNEDKIEDGEYPFFVRSENIERINSYSYDCEAILVPGEGRIGEIFHYVNGRFDAHQRVYAITQFDPDMSAKFIHLYMTMHFGPWAMQNSVKATVDSLRLPTFQTFHMRVPPTNEEQTAIAMVLTDINAELEALERRRNKTHYLKNATMQELLSGRTRLVPVEAPNA